VAQHLEDPVGAAEQQGRGEQCAVKDVHGAGSF
jgi:hypothetical protein